MLLEQFLEKSAEKRPGKIALVDGPRCWTYGESESRANRLAHALHAEGVRRGDRVGIYLENSAEAVCAIFGVLKAGAVFMMINPTTKADKLAYILNNSRATALITHQEKGRDLGALWFKMPHLKCLFMAGPDGQSLEHHEKKAISLASIWEGGSWPDQPPPKRCIDMDLAALIYTSGSTGKPKGVMLSHLNMISAINSITAYLENRPEDIILSALPLSFDYGLYQVLMSAAFGGTVVLERSFAYPYAVMENLVKEKVTGFPIVPTMAALLLQMDLSPFDFSHLRYITNTAAALPVEHIQRLRQLFPGASLYSMYGLTECKRVSYLPPDQLDIRPDSVGRGMPNEEVYVVDDNGFRVGPGVIGELVVRGSNVMKGYWELPDETDRVLRAGPLPGEKVLYTGDLFKMDEDGYLYFVGRKDDIIKTRGEKISPKEVEEVIYRLDAVAEAAVIPAPDELLGQAVHAVVSLKDNLSITERDILLHCKKHLEDFMVPKIVHIWLEPLPKSANGKIDKRTLAEQLFRPADTVNNDVTPEALSQAVSL